MTTGILNWLWTIFSTFKNFQLPKIALFIVATKMKTIENSEFLIWIPNRISHHNLSNTSVTRVSLSRITSKEKNRRQRVHSLFLILNPLLRKCRSFRIFSTVSRYSSIVVEKQLTTISPPRFSIMNIARPFIPRSVISMTIIEIFFCGDGRLEFEKATRVPLWDVVLDPMARATVRIGIRN